PRGPPVPAGAPPRIVRFVSARGTATSSATSGRSPPWEASRPARPWRIAATVAAPGPLSPAASSVPSTPASTSPVPAVASCGVASSWARSGPQSPGAIRVTAPLSGTVAPVAGARAGAARAPGSCGAEARGETVGLTAVRGEHHVRTEAVRVGERRERTGVEDAAVDAGAGVALLVGAVAAQQVDAAAGAGVVGGQSRPDDQCVGATDG